MNGILRGCGAQFKGSIIMVFGLTGVGLVAALFFEFYMEMGVTGFYWGLCIGVLVEFLLLGLTVIRTNWTKMVQEVREDLH